jgi:hypothetical protein
MMLPNISLHVAWGKLLFSAADIAVALLILRRVCKKCYQAEWGTNRTQSLTNIALAFWLFNPYTATISTRGNGDALVVLMQLLVLMLLQQSGTQQHASSGSLHAPAIADTASSFGSSAATFASTATSGAVYGLLVHWRVFPVIYGPSLLLFFWHKARKVHHITRPNCPCQYVLWQIIQSCVTLISWHATAGVPMPFLKRNDARTGSTCLTEVLVYRELGPSLPGLEAVLCLVCLPCLWFLASVPSFITCTGTHFCKKPTCTMQADGILGTIFPHTFSLRTFTTSARVPEMEPAKLLCQLFSTQLCLHLFAWQQPSLQPQWHTATIWTCLGS